MVNKLKFITSSVLVLLNFSLIQKASSADYTYDLVEKVYDENVTYGSGVFNYHEDANFLRTLPREQNEPYPQHVLAYNQRPENYFGREESILGVVRPLDGRDRIQNTSQWPHRIHAKLTMTRGQEMSWHGSGVLVGPHHLLTCAHNVYKRQGGQGAYFEGISIYPALNDNITPFNSARVVKAYVFREWVDRGDPRFDMALLLLDQSIGNFTGWGGLLSTSPAELLKEPVSITGYPGDKGLNQMWSMSHRIQTVMDEEFHYIIDTFSGQSGSAVWINRWGMPMVLGVHTLGSDLRNSGVRLSRQKLTKILEKISDTYTLSLIPSSPMPPLIGMTLGQIKVLSDLNIAYPKLMEELDCIQFHYKEENQQPNILYGGYSFNYRSSKKPDTITGQASMIKSEIETLNVLLEQYAASMSKCERARLLNTVADYGLAKDNQRRIVFIEQELICLEKMLIELVERKSSTLPGFAKGETLRQIKALCDLSTAYPNLLGALRHIEVYYRNQQEPPIQSYPPYGFNFISANKPKSITGQASMIKSEIETLNVLLEQYAASMSKCERARLLNTVADYGLAKDNQRRIVFIEQELICLEKMLIELVGGV